MKRFSTYFSSILIVTTLSGCASFLDVNPKVEVFDKDMFTSAEGYEDALYGVYSELGSSEKTYAGVLTLIPDVMCQNLTATANYIYGNFATAEWETNGPMSAKKSIWTEEYSAINHLNNIIMHAEEDGTGKFKYSGLYYGEALALRAMLHFDLVRYFGPPFWAPETLKAKAIPYVKTYSFDITPYSSLDQVYEQIIEDLKKAEGMMGEDMELIPETRTNSAGGFTDARITHMNLYAVQALLARVYWTKGDLDNAAIYAQKVIDSKKFSFRPLSTFVQSEGGVLDLNETIFGLYSLKCHSTFGNLFGISKVNTTIFLASDWKTLYEEGSGVSTDYRVSSWFDSGADKLTKISNTSTASGNQYSGINILGINILRIPEMYYIMAEYYMDSNPRLATEYFNAVIETRGLHPIEDGKLDYDMLFKERRKEFYGEGFTWHEMKKLGMDINTAAGTTLSGKSPATYTIPIPDEEDQSRNNLD